MLICIATYPGIFPSTFQPYETLKIQKKLLLLQTNDVQVMLLQSERVSEMPFSATWRPTIEAPHEDS